MLMMVPPDPRSIMRRPAAWDMRNVPLTFTRSTWSKRSRGISAGGAPHVAPLLLTIISRLPKVSSACDTTLSTSSGSVTSHSTATGDYGRPAVETEEIQGVQSILLLALRRSLCLRAFLVYQDATQELAYGALGQFLAEFYGLRSLIGGEALLAEGQYLLLRRVSAGPLYYKGLDGLTAVFVGDTDCYSLGHVRMFEKHLFDLARVHVVA